MPEIAGLLGKSRDGVENKMYGLGLRLKQHKNRSALDSSLERSVFSSEKLAVPSELPNVEEAVRLLAAALLKSTEALWRGILCFLSLAF